MKTRLLTFLAITLSTLSLVAFYQVFSLQAQGGVNSEPVDYTNNSAQYLAQYCGFSNLETRGISKKYLQATNDFFNLNIRKLMVSEKKVNPAAADVSIPTNFPPNITEFDQSPNKALCKKGSDNYTCKMLALCKDNNSTYCVGMNALGFSPRYAGSFDADQVSKNFSYLKSGYFCYRTALLVQRDNILELTGDSILQKCKDNDPNYQDDDICITLNNLTKESDATKRAAIQTSLDQLMAARGYSSDIFNISASSNERIQNIDAELVKSKQALDATVEAYSQLQGSWRLHKRYIKLFEDLVKYRDYLADVRRQTDAFPFKFVDATTTRCL